MTTEPTASDDSRNVIDRYKGWPMEAIIADLDSRRHPFHIAIENWQHDFNIGSVVRTANAFLAKEVHIIGRRRWNRRGAMVTDRYQHVRHHPTVEEFVAWAHAEGLPVLGIDNLPGSVPLETYDLPKACVLVFGQESVGLSDEVREAADAVLQVHDVVAFADFAGVGNGGTLVDLAVDVAALVAAKDFAVGDEVEATLGQDEAVVEEADGHDDIAGGVCIGGDAAAAAFFNDD